MDRVTLDWTNGLANGTNGDNSIPGNTFPARIPSRELTVFSTSRLERERFKRGDSANGPDQCKREGKRKTPKSAQLLQPLVPRSMMPMTII